MYSDSVSRLIALHEELAALEGCVTLLEPWSELADLTTPLKEKAAQIELTIKELGEIGISG